MNTEQTWLSKPISLNYFNKNIKPRKKYIFQFLPFLSTRKKMETTFITWHARFSMGLIIALFDQG